MNEAQAGAKWLYGKLNALTAGGAHETQAPQGTALPCVIFHLQADTDVPGVGDAGRLVAELLYLIKAVCEGGSYAPADALAHDVDEALCGAEGDETIDGSRYHLVTVGREAALRNVDTVNGKRYPWSGGLYRIQAQVF